MQSYNIKEGLHWVGALDPDLRVFDVIMYTAHGTTYNSYLVQGKKTAVVEAVKERFFDEWVQRLSHAGVELADIDYLILNHTEPDHTGAVRRLLDIAPNVKIVCSRPASTLIKEITNTPLDIQVANDGDELDLGGKTLRFISAPFLHWPDTMFTYIPEDKSLLSGDVFGFHHCANGIFDDVENMDNLRDSQKYYFDVIMSPFKAYARQACEKVRGLDIDMIGPSHGPVLRSDPWDAVQRYEEWSRAETWSPQRAFVGYVSCYGYTAMLAEAIADELKQFGLDVRLLNLEDAKPEEAAEMAMQSDLIFIGSSTVNRDALPPVWDMLSRISAIRTRGRIGAAFGSFGWSGEASKFILARMEQLGLNTAAGTYTCKMYPSPEQLDEARALAANAAEQLSK